MSALPELDVLTRQKSPAPDRRQAASMGSSESLPEIRVDGQRVGDGQTPVARFDIGGGVRAGGRADVAALAVGDDDQLGGTRIVAHPLERSDSIRPESLEERKLRLDADDVLGDRVDDPAAKALTRFSGRETARVGGSSQLDREKLGPRIEADDELASLPLDGLGEPVGKRAGEYRGRVFQLAGHPCLG